MMADGDGDGDIDGYNDGAMTNKTANNFYPKPVYEDQSNSAIYNGS